jgi:hypothetical protein
MELLILFFLGVRDSEGGPSVFARSNKVGEENAGVESSTGSEGECVMDGILDGLRLVLFTGFSDGNGGSSWVRETEAASSSAAVLTSGEECVR